MLQLALDAAGVVRAAMADHDLDETVSAVLEVWADRVDAGEMSPQTAEKFDLLLRRFVRFAAAMDTSTMDGFSTSLAAQFIAATGKDRHGRLVPPAAATQHQRRSVLRLFARDATRLGYLLADPTQGIDLPRRAQSQTRPVNEDEAALLQCFAESWATPTRHAATVALALTGAHTGEIARVTIPDVRDGRVQLPGGTRVTPRQLPLSPWTQRVLRDRADLVSSRHGSTACLVSTGRGSADQEQARVCTTIREIVRRAGLGAEPDLRPASLTAHAAATVFAQTGRIEAAAAVLGYQSLDSTARIIGWDWQARP